MPDVNHFEKKGFISQKVVDNANEAVDEINRLSREFGQFHDNGQDADDDGNWERPWLGVVVEKGPNDEDDYDADDPRYWVQRCLVQPNGGSPDMNDKIKVLKIDPPEVESGDDDPFGVIHTVTNLAERNHEDDTDCLGSHLLPVGSYVYVWQEESYLDEDDDTGYSQPHYVMRHTPQLSVVVLVSANASGGGKYTGSILSRTSDATADGDESMPEGLTTGDDALILHLPEDGKPTHWIELGTYATGVIVGKTLGGDDDATPTWIVTIPNGTYRTADPSSMTGTGTDADTSTWDRDVETSGTDYGDSPVEITFVSRIEIDTGTMELLSFSRTALFDAGGNLKSVSDETKNTVDTGADCTTP